MRRKISMKRLLFVCMVLVVSIPGFADHSAGMGIGAVVGSSYGASGVGGTLGVSLKLPSLPVYWAAGMQLDGDSFSVVATGDWYLIDTDLYSENGFNLDWFLGAGVYATMGLHKDETQFSLGARLPIGFSWHASQKVEVFFDVAPAVGFTTEPRFPAWGISAELGFRMWMDR